MLGGRSIYEPVEERLPIQVRADTPEGLTRAINKLALMLETADIFYQYETGNAVLFHYRSKEAQDKQPLTAMVRRSLAPIVLPTDYVSMSEGDKEYYTAEVVIRFERGDWLYPSEAITSSTVTTHWQNIYTATFTDYAYHQSPCQYTLGIGSNTTVSPNGYIAFQADGTTELLTTPALGTYSTTAETGSTSGNVFRVSATGNLSWTFAGGSSSQRAFHVFVKLRMNSGSWRIRSVDYGYPNQVNTPYQTVVGTSPQVLYLGVHRVPAAIGAIGIGLIEDTAGTLDIDSLLVLGINESTNIVALSTTQTSSSTHITTFGADPLTTLSPKIYLGDWDIASISGDIWILNRGQTIKIMPYLVGGTFMNPYSAGLLSAYHVITRWIAQPGGN
jgi:hypothetical protein